jgi:hypothetical protein
MGTAGKRSRWAKAFVPLSLIIATGLVAASSFGASVVSASFSGGANTVSVGGTLYAKNGGALTLTVNTSPDTQCVELAGAHTARQTSATPKSSWTFDFTAGNGDGIQTVTAAAFSNFNATKCTGQSKDPQTASYILDNTGPLVTGAISPAANSSGWNNGNVSVTWSAADGGSGLASGPTPANDSQTVDTAGVTKTSSAADRLGNVGSGQVTIKLDRTSPSITGVASPAANAFGWNNTDVAVSFTCSDALSGVESCAAPSALSNETPADGTSVPGAAVDNADNSASTSVAPVKIDKTAPSLTGAPTTSPNAAGWYKSNVTIHWAASDGLSGLANAAPADSTISSEGTGLTTSASVSDKAGNSTNATSSPAVKIDKTPPVTNASAPPAWNNVDVTVELSAGDGLSGVAATYYSIDGGSVQTYSPVTKPSFTSEGVHALEYWSEDEAGNAEAHHSIQVRIDKTPPTISAQKSPAANANGWNNSDVTVSFICADALSEVASCSPSEVVSSEAADQGVTGTALDNAGNSATAHTSVSLDKTPPTITAVADRAANDNGWYDDDVAVSFTCGDSLSGIDTCPAPMTLGQGADQSASGTARDNAGNTASDGVSGISVDKTDPSLSGAATTSPNGNGWYSGDVTIHWTASDALSGLDGAAPGDSTITGEGDNLSTSASVADKAGNSTNTTVSGIKIDRTPPSTLASVPAPLESGWYAGDVEVTLTTGADLSGIDKTYYSVDGGTAQLYGGPFQHTPKGVHTITFWSVDKAGNVEDKNAPGHELTLKIDGVPPTINGSRSPAANAFGWNNGPVLVTFNCSDAESGIAGCVGDTTVSNEGAGQSVTGTAQDNAGNTASATVNDINIDQTAPTLSGAATTSPNAFGWYKGDVTIHWTGEDFLSGIDPATQPSGSTIGGEGENLGAGPASISDKAGNIGSGSVSGVKIDRTAPKVSAGTVNDDGTTRSPNAAGWFNSAVRVRFTCSDALSGMQECPGDVVLADNGANQSATRTATDKADNSAGTTLGAINIDSQAPKTEADLQCTGKNGYCRGHKATVVLSSTDQAGLSGVKEIRYSTNNGSSWQSAQSPASVDLNLSGSGKAKVLFYAVDKAGNAESQDGVDVKFDTIAPSVTHALEPEANAAGWNNADTTVRFDANDDSDGSGVDTLSIDGVVAATQSSTPPTSLSALKQILGETPGQAVAASAADFAGNLGADSVTVKIDKTDPKIDGAPTAAPNGNGWYSGPVTVHYACADQGAVQSGIATCPADDVKSANGANQSSSGTAVDKAGNTTSTTVSGINIDTVRPAITISGRKEIYTLGETVSLGCSANDSGGSGIDAPCIVATSGGNANGVGTFTFTATAKDNAGNTATETGTYKVVYRFDGFLQPINDTAHQVGVNVSVFKAGSTVPAKLQLKKADGTIVQALAVPTWLNPVKGSATTAPPDESVYGDAPTSGGAYRYDAGAQQYIYNWGTPKSASGYYWRVGVALDDGQTYYVNIGLR